MITCPVQATGAPAPQPRTDTQLIPLPGLRPLPARLDPRARGIGETLLAVARAVLIGGTVLALLLVAVSVAAAVLVAGALVMPQSVLIAGICALVLLYPFARARAAR